MPVGRPSPEKFKEVQLLIEEHYTEPEPQHVNAREAAELDEPAYLPFRGHTYRVDPIHYRAGFKLLALVQEYGEATQEKDPDELTDVLDRMTDLYAELVEPVGVRRLFSWLLPNPFRGASEREVLRLTDFFWTFQTGESLFTSLRKAAHSGHRSSIGSAPSTSSSRRSVGSPIPGEITFTE